ncbi:MAG: S8 family peptidase, partial [Bacteroidia bacterium]
MFKRILLFITCLHVSVAYAQTFEKPAKFQVVFKDKGELRDLESKPIQFLSEASLQRRKKQGISLQWNDYPVNSAYVQQLKQKGFRVLNISRWFNSVSVYVQDSATIKELLAYPFVKTVRPVTKVLVSVQDENGLSLQKQKEKNRKAFKPAFQQKNSIESSYGFANGQIAQIELQSLHQMGFKGDSVLVAVLDAGFYNCDRISFFDSLRLQSRIIGTHDFVMGDDSVYEDNYHVMSVLSCMAANKPGQFVGTAPGAQYLLLRTEDAGSEFVIEEDNWVAAAEFADSAGAWIINSSLGYTEFDDPQTSHTYADLDGNSTHVTRGADIAASKGILVVNSAGNSGDNAWRYIGAPADGDSVLTIGAVDSLGNYATFSSQGPSADGRIKPNVSCTGQATWIVTSSGNIGRANGTSFSSPILAGAAACLWQAFPDATNMEIYNAIEQSAHQYENPDNLIGYGIPN